MEGGTENSGKPDQMPYRFPQWLISFSGKKKSNKLCFSLFLLLDPILCSWQSQGEVSAAVCHNLLCSLALCSVPGCFCLTRVQGDDNKKTHCLWGTAIVMGHDHFTFFYTLYWGGKTIAVQFFALQSALLGDVRTKWVTPSHSLKISCVWKGARKKGGERKRHYEHESPLWSGLVSS